MMIGPLFAIYFLGIAFSTFLGVVWYDEFDFTEKEILACILVWPLTVLMLFWKSIKIVLGLLK